MTRIIIEDVTNLKDLLEAISTVSAVFADGASFEIEQHTFSRSPDTRQVEMEGRPLEPEPVRPRCALPYQPCPRRGQHLRLADCWMCWADVQRGAAIEMDVLAAEAWDLSLARLLNPGIGSTKSGEDVGNRDRETVRDLDDDVDW
jgi:hypothetical protein